jgi:hypothetical protein
VSKIKVFFLEPTGRLRRFLRRYVSAENEDSKKCSLRYGWHNAEFHLDDIEDVDSASTINLTEHNHPEQFKGDRRWPSHCGCSYEFQASDIFQIHLKRLFRRTDTGEEMILNDAPAGACWFADWMLVEGSNHYRGPDDHSLVVRCPDGHDWCVDSRASNCDSPCSNCRVIYRDHQSSSCKS